MDPSWLLAKSQKGKFSKSKKKTRVSSVQGITVLRPSDQIGERRELVEGEKGKTAYRDANAGGEIRVKKSLRKGP